MPVDVSAYMGRHKVSIVVFRLQLLVYTLLICSTQKSFLKSCIFAHFRYFFWFFLMIVLALYKSYNSVDFYFVNTNNWFICMSLIICVEGCVNLVLLVLVKADWINFYFWCLSFLCIILFKIGLSSRLKKSKKMCKMCVNTTFYVNFLSTAYM